MRILLLHYYHISLAALCRDAWHPQFYTSLLQEINYYRIQTDCCIPCQHSVPIPFLF